jgi:small nuclear ribonucleoprotein E
MNVVLDDAAEVYVKDVKPRKELGSSPSLISFYAVLTHVTVGRILLKGDNITLIQQVA